MNNFNQITQDAFRFKGRFLANKFKKLESMARKFVETALDINPNIVFAEPIKTVDGLYITELRKNNSNIVYRVAKREEFEDKYTPQYDVVLSERKENNGMWLMLFAAISNTRIINLNRDAILDN